MAEGTAADDAVVAQLMSMGFNENGCKRAALATSNNVEAAMEWIFAHMEDADFNDPVLEGGRAGEGASTSQGVNQEALTMLCNMGFNESHVRAVLQHTNNDAERAADWLFSHNDDLEGSIRTLQSGGPGVAGAASATAAGTSIDTNLDDGTGRYRLRGFISHIGRNTGSGHYVAHIRKSVPGHEGEHWVIFNDQSVALSQNPPREHAYLYLYERVAL